MEGYLSTLPSHTMRPCETGNDTPGVISLVFSNQFVLEPSSTFRQTDSRDNTPGVLSQAFSDLFVLAMTMKKTSTASEHHACSMVMPDAKKYKHKWLWL
jgi:hypothetical protein